MVVTGKNQNWLLAFQPGKLPLVVVEKIVAVLGFHQKTAVEYISYLHVKLLLWPILPQSFVRGNRESID